MRRVRRRRRLAAAPRIWKALVRGAGGLSVAAGSLLGRATPALAQVTLSPGADQGPGGPQLQQLVNWLAGMGLTCCVAAMVFHALRWGWGSQQHNMARVQDGKEGVGRSAMVAGIIGASAALVNFAVGLGTAVK